MSKKWLSIYKTYDFFPIEKAAIVSLSKVTDKSMKIYTGNFCTLTYLAPKAEPNDQKWQAERAKNLIYVKIIWVGWLIDW